ncbi:hypothetical protein TNCV_3372911 [Trichonephila clavipes]|nr:hypothetical protein TNCV_3372911 [Trichonephila clavipes]
MLVRVYEDQILSVKNNGWFACFREGRDSVYDNPRSGRPVTSVSDENIEKVHVTFFDSQDIIYKQFLPEGAKMNAAKYIEVFTRFMKRLRRVRSQRAQQVSWGFFCSRQYSPYHRHCQTFSSKKGSGANLTSFLADFNPSDFLFPESHSI